MLLHHFKKSYGNKGRRIKRYPKLYSNNKSYFRIKSKSLRRISNKYHEDVNYVCKLSHIKIIEEEYGKLKNYDVVITDERILHLEVRRGLKDTKILINNLKNVIKNCDSIYDDTSIDESGNKNFGIAYIKEYDDMFLSIMVSLSTKESKFANSVITGIILGDKSMKRKFKNTKKIV